MAEFNAYLRLNGKCREAMSFYQTCFGGSLNLMTVGESPMKNQMPPQAHSQILHSILTSGSIMIMGTDLNSEAGFSHGTSVSLCLVCQSRDEIETLFSRLSEGGRVTTPLSELYFGTYGDLVDAYGFIWLFQYGKGNMV